jgi:ATP-dependent DNA ligase
MNDDRIIDILSSIPKEILLNCAEIIYQKNKKIKTLKTEIKEDSLVKPLSKLTIKKKMASGSKNVMLAHVYDPDKHAKKVVNWWMSVKYDGVRAKWNGEEMETRTGLIYTLPDFLTKQLQSIRDDDGNPMELDGELWAGNDTFAYMSGLARRHENDPKQWEPVIYMVFDTPDPDLTFEERIKKVGIALKRSDNHPNIKGVKHRRFDPLTMDIDTELKKVEDDGGEGLVLRKPKSLYVFKRSQDMLKVKSWSYKEAVVVGYAEGTNRLSGLVGSLMVKSNDFGDEDEDEKDKKWVNFKVGSGLNDWQRFTGGVVGNWKSKEVQKKIDDVRKEHVKVVDKNNKTYIDLVDTIKNSTGKVKIDALHQMNEYFTQMPCIGDIVTFRFKELTKDGNPSMPTFVGIRDYE